MSIKGHDIAKDLALLDEQERKVAIKKALTLESALRSGDVDAIYKAQNYFQLQQRKLGLENRFSLSPEGTKAIMIDPYETSNSMGYYAKNTPLSNTMLRAMARTPVLAAIIATRKNQVADFAAPPADKYSNGFVIEKIGVESEDDLSDSDKRVIEELTNFVINCGNEENKFDNPNFNTFIRLIVDDALTLDAASTEVVPNRGFEPDRFSAVDGATIRYADTFNNQPKEGRLKVNGYYPKYVQVIDGRIRAEFYPWEMCYGIRNPSTNIYSNGYGRSESEDLVTTVTNLVNADKYNGSIFKTGASPKGALMIKKGNINKDAVAQIRRDWNAMLSGAEQNGKTLILDGESVEYVNMHISNKDMEYQQFYELMVKLSCAKFTISPEEIGFTLQGAAKGGGLGSKEGGKQEKDYSKDKGLKPLLTFIASWINEYVIGPKTNFKFRFKFTGLDIESAQEEEERLQKAVALYMTPDEVRALKKMKPLPNGMGKYPLNPIIAQQLMGQQQSQQAQDEQDQAKSDEQFNNTSPFIEDEKEEESPLEKSFNEYFESRYLVSE